MRKQTLIVTLGYFIKVYNNADETRGENFKYELKIVK